MKKEGFTLVELLGVIVLLGIISLVIIPKVGDTITNSKNTAYEVQITNIKKGISDYIIDKNILQEDGSITIKLGSIKQAGYLPISIKNPISKKNISNESLALVTRTNGKYDIQLQIIDVNYSEMLDSNAPIIILNGNYIEYVEVKNSYQEKGAIAKTSEGEEINDISIQILMNEQEQSSINTNALNTYNIVYSVTDGNGIQSSATRTVIVRDTTPPKINVPKDETIHMSEVQTYDISEGVEVTDNYDNNPDLIINGAINNRTGIYVINYIARDASGNEAIARRVIKVIDN